MYLNNKITKKARMSETDNDESQPGFEEELQMIRDYVEEHPDDENA